MKIAVNNDYGGYELKDKYYNKLDRDDPELIQYLEKHKDNMNEIQYSFSSIKIVEIPDETTAWYIHEDDGAETLIYVVNGKIYEAYP